MNQSLDLDRDLRAGLRQSALRSGGVSAAILLASLVVLLVTGPTLAVMAFAGAFLAMSLLPLDLVLRFRRPAPRLIDSGIELRSSRLVGGVLASMSLLLTVAAVGLLTDPDVFDQRRAGALPFAVVIGLLLTAASMTMVWRPGLVKVAPEGIGTKRLAERSSSIGWDEVESVGLPPGLPRQQYSALVLEVRGTYETIRLATTTLDPTVWVLRDWLQHYVDHVDDRHELAGQAGLDRLAAIEAELSTRLLRPRWFAPPRTES